MNVPRSPISKWFLCLTLLLLGGALVVGCGRKQSKTKFTKIKRGSQKEQKEKVAKSVAAIFDTIGSVSNDTNPVEVVKTISPIVKDKLNGMASKSEEQSRLVTRWTAFSEGSVVFTLNHEMLGAEWLKVMPGDGGLANVSDLLCEKKKQTTKPAATTNNKVQTKSKTVKCDTYYAPMRCLDAQSNAKECNNLLILVYNVDQGFILPIYHRQISVSEVAENIQLQVPASLLSKLGMGEAVSPKGFNFSYSAMLFNRNSQRSKLVLTGVKTAESDTSDPYQESPAVLLVKSK